MRSRLGLAQTTARVLLMNVLVLSATPARAETNLAAELSTLLDGVPPGTDVGLVVADAQTGEVLYEHQGDTPLKPASVLKLLTTAAAIEHLGPGFRYETGVYVAGDELWVVGAGDPALGDERICERRGLPHDIFSEWARQLQTRGIQRIGKVVLDDTIFDSQGRHPDWPGSQQDRWYQAPVGGLNLNNNCLDVEIVLRGGEIDLRLQPDLPRALVDNGARRGDKHRPILRRPAESDVFELRGTLRSGGELPPVAARDATLFFAYALKQGLENHGIQVGGSVVRRHLRETELAGAQLVARHVTPMADVLWRCNTHSQNMFAESLMKSLAAYESDGRRSDRPGGWDAARPVLLAALRRVGVDLEGAVVRDGCGLSHENRVTAAQVVQLLVQMRRHRHGRLFLESLAEAGEVGTMRRRYDDPLLRGRVRGKTGTIAGVHTLAAYVTRPDDTELACALLINGQANGELLEQVCRLLASDAPPR